MGRRRKTRTHVKAANAPGNSGEDVPKSFIVKHGQVGTSLTQLVRDLRKVMEPNTATRLKERKRNKLKDFLTMAPALKVTHLLALTLTELAPSLRIVRLPVGPTFSFRVERYSVMKDVRKTSKSALSQGLEYLTAPLLVLASFPPPSPNTPPHLPLLMKAFQSMFPPLAPNSMSLSGARRVVLIAYNAEKGTIDFRHYVITVKPYGVSKRVRRVLEGTSKKPTGTSMTGLLNLGNEKDIADFLLRKKGEPGPDSEAGYESAASSASSVAGDDGDTVSLAGDYVGRNNKRGQKKAVKLNEVGPRMELKLIKITEGVPGKEGEVMYHEFGMWDGTELQNIGFANVVIVKKTRAEAAALRTSHAERAKLREQRRQEQEENVRRKKEAKGVATQKSSGSIHDSADESDEPQTEDEWNEEEEVSDGEGTGSEDDPESASEESDADEPPRKISKTRIKR
ncbi:Brix domain-containing protein [Scleroderma citrinum]